MYEMCFLIRIIYFVYINLRVLGLYFIIFEFNVGLKIQILVFIESFINKLSLYNCLFLQEFVQKYYFYLYFCS